MEKIFFLCEWTEIKVLLNTKVLNNMMKYPLWEMGMLIQKHMKYYWKDNLTYVKVKESILCDTVKMKGKFEVNMFIFAEQSSRTLVRLRTSKSSKSFLHDSIHIEKCSYNPSIHLTSLISSFNQKMC